MKRIFVILSFGLLWGCVKQSTHEQALRAIDSLMVVNQTLIEENDELLNGEKRLIDYIELHNRNNDVLKSYDFIVKLRSKHPESDYITKNEQLLIAIENEARIMLDSIEKAKQDSIRRANIHELGIWKIGEYVDDFGEPTGEKFLCANVMGVFSNSATAQSLLRVYVEMSKYGIGLDFDEYNNGTYEDEDFVFVKIINKEARKIYEGSGNSSFSFLYDVNEDWRDRTHTTLTEILRKEGVYEFYIESKYRTIYRFMIDSRCLENAMFKAEIKDI